MKDFSGLPWELHSGIGKGSLFLYDTLLKS